MEIHGIVNMYEANPKDRHFLMLNLFDTIMTPHPHMPIE